MNHQRRYLTPGASNINKRKFDFDAFKPSSPHTQISKPGFTKPPPSPKPASEPVFNNLLLAGYLAHEILTKGTLFGKQWDPARAEAVPVSASAESKRRRRSEKPDSEPEEKKRRIYVEMAGLMKTEGIRISGIVNPTQLASYLHME